MITLSTKQLRTARRTVKLARAAHIASTRPKITPSQRARLEALWPTDERAGAILRAADGESSASIASDLGYTRQEISRWIQRWRKGGLRTLNPRRGRPRTKKA